MSHRDDCPSRWQARERARDDYEYFHGSLPRPPSSYRDCDEARREYEYEWYAAREEEEARLAEQRRAQQGAEEEAFYREAEQRRYEEEMYERQYEEWCEEQMQLQYEAYMESERYHDFVAISRWADDGGPSQ